MTRPNKSLQEVLQLKVSEVQSPLSDDEQTIAENDLKFFSTTKKTKVGVKHVDLV